MVKHKYIFLLTVCIALFLANSCSIKKMAMNQVAGALTGPGSSTVFLGDNDPQLVGEALPF
ncbi:MAG: hypothetical protein GY765_43340, partial [bacterium]|nr:hypothetical protein [bacterium]